MAGVGTLFDMTGIVAGGVVGLTFARFFTDNLRKMMMILCGLSVLVIGLTGVLQEMLVVGKNGLQTQGTLVLILSLILGTVIGEFIDIEKQITRFGSWLQRKSGNSKDPKFVGGFVEASLTVCIGAMAILGPISEALYHDHSTLIAKSIFDFIIIIILTIPHGRGCLFAALPVGLCQGTITLLSGKISPVMTDAALSNLTLAGSAIILCLGINLVWDKKIRVANMMPAILVAVAFAYLPFG